MADPVSVVLIFSGLIAFVPNLKGDDPQAITALLLKDYGEHQHYQLLRVPVSTLSTGSAGCPRAYCHITEKVPTGEGTATYCDCPLNGAKISLDPMLLQEMEPFPAKPEGVLPGSGNANSIAWLVRLRNLDPKFSELDRVKFSKFSGSQITFRSTKAATCAFDEELGEVFRTVFNNKFIQQGKVVHEQAVAEMAVFVVPVGEVATQVKVKVASENNFDLMLSCPDALSCPIVLLNLPKPLPAGMCIDCSDCIYGNHFAEYWKLTGRSIGGGAVPRRECGIKSTIDIHSNLVLCPDYLTVAGELARSRISLEALPSPEFAAIEADEQKSFLKPTIKALNSTLIKIRKTVGSRIICPMAVIEP